MLCAAPVAGRQVSLDMRGVTFVFRSVCQLRAAAGCSQEATHVTETSLKSLTRAAKWPEAAAPTRHAGTRDGMHAFAPAAGMWARSYEQRAAGALQLARSTKTYAKCTDRVRRLLGCRPCRQAARPCQVVAFSATCRLLDHKQRYTPHLAYYVIIIDCLCNMSCQLGQKPES